MLYQVLIWRRLYPAGCCFVTSFNYNLFPSSKRNDDRNRWNSKSHSRDTFLFLKAAPSNATFLDGALHCKTPEHLSAYSLLYIHKNV